MEPELIAGLITAAIGGFAFLLLTGSKHKIAKVQIAANANATHQVEVAAHNEAVVEMARVDREITEVNDLPQDDRLDVIADIANEMFQ